MFDIGWSELVIIGVVALIIVGPKDLPMMFRKVGEFVGRMRAMAGDFRRAMDQAADESGVKDIADSVKQAADLKNDLSMDGLNESVKDYAKSYATVDNPIASVSPPAEDTIKEEKAKVKKSPAPKPKPKSKKPASPKPAAKSADTKAKAKSPSRKKAPAKKTTAKAVS